jgi:hypothetical protein
MRRGVTVVRGMRPHRPSNPLLGGLAVMFGALFIGVMLTCIVSIAIWPGEAKLLEPLLCTDARPDAVVVYDTYNVRPGETVTNFSLYCMGPRGDVTDHGWAKVFFLLSGFHTLLALALMGIGVLRGKSKNKPEQPDHMLITPG